MRQKTRHGCTGRVSSVREYWPERVTATGVVRGGTLTRPVPGAVTRAPTVRGVGGDVVVAANTRPAAAAAGRKGGCDTPSAMVVADADAAGTGTRSRRIKTRAPRRGRRTKPGEAVGTDVVGTELDGAALGKGPLVEAGGAAAAAAVRVGATLAAAVAVAAAAEAGAARRINLCEEREKMRQCGDGEGRAVDVDLGAMAVEEASVAEARAAALCVLGSSGAGAGALVAGALAGRDGPRALAPALGAAMGAAARDGLTQTLAPALLDVPEVARPGRTQDLDMAGGWRHPSAEWRREYAGNMCVVL